MKTIQHGPTWCVCMLALCALAGTARATTSAHATVDERMILRLADGTHVRGPARAVDGGYEVKRGGRWELLAHDSVEGARLEREVLAERRVRLDAVPQNHLGARVEECRWMIGAGLDAEAADELDRLLRVLPDEPHALRLLAATPPRIDLCVSPGADGSMRDALLREGARTCNVGGSRVRRELVVQALAEDAARADAQAETQPEEQPEAQPVETAADAGPAEAGDAVRASRTPAQSASAKRASERTVSGATPTESPSVVAVVRDAFAHLAPGCLHADLIEELGSSVTSRRTFASVALRRLYAQETIGPLAVHAVLDPSMEVRNESSLGLRTAGDPRACGAVVQALANQSPLVRQHAIEALGNMGYAAAVEPLMMLMTTANAAGGGGAGGGPIRANIYIGLQTAYVQDFNVEIAQAASIADPIVGLLQHGVVFDVGVGGVSSVSVTTEIWTAARSLVRLTGARIGADPAAWEKWWKENRHRYVPGAEREPGTRD